MTTYYVQMKTGELITIVAHYADMSTNSMVFFDQDGEIDAMIPVSSVEFMYNAARARNFTVKK